MARCTPDRCSWATPPSRAGRHPPTTSRGCRNPTAVEHARHCQLQRALLARFDTHEQRLFTVLVQQLDGHALVQAETLRQAAESGRLTDFDMKAILGALQEFFVEVQRHNGLLVELSRQVDLAQAEDALRRQRQRPPPLQGDSPAATLVPYYGGEVEWENGVDLLQILRRLLVQWHNESSVGDDP